jgi:lysophospholipase L1-like esterase
LLVTVLVLGGVECSLRLAGAVVVSEQRAAPMQGAAIWAFGDSYTFGIGATDSALESYPAVTARLVSEATGATVSVRNFALPGLNSTRIVASLRAALADGRPRFVLLLAGVNNTRWLGQSGRFCLDEGTPPPPRAVQQLRTYKVLRHILLQRRGPRAADVACHAVAEGFHHLDEGRPIEADERFASALKALPTSGWARVGLGIAASRRGRHADAVRWFDETEGLGVMSPALPLAHAFALRSAGRMGDARAVLDGATLDGDLTEVAALLRGRLLHDEARYSEAAVALEAVARGTQGAPAGGGIVPFALDGLGWTRLAQDDLAGARAAFLEANAAGDPIHVTPHLMGWSHLGLAAVGAIERRPLDELLPSLEMARRDSSATSASLALEAYLLGESCAAAEGPAQAAMDFAPHELARSVLGYCSDARHFTPGLTVANVLSVLPSLPTPAVQQWFDPTDTFLLTSDLREAVSLTRDAGAVPILLTYPQPAAHDEIAEAVLRLGADLQVAVVDPRQTFAAAHDGGRAWSELLIPDGHPTTAGYALVAEGVAREIQAAQRKDGGGW